MLIQRTYQKKIYKFLLASSILILACNIALITESRSSFLALIGMLTILFLNKNANSFSILKNTFLTLTALTLVITLFFLTPSSRQSINTAIHEYQLSQTSIDVPYETISRRDGDVATSFASIETITKKFNWRPRFGLSEMCEDSWRWQRTLNNG